MWQRRRSAPGCLQRHCALAAALVLALLGYFEQVSCMPVLENDNWPTFPRRNIAALARDGYLRARFAGYKRSISTLAKNGQLPTFRAPYNEEDEARDDGDSHEKRNLASIARMRSYEAVKRNIQALARDGYRSGRGPSSQDQKRNVAALARNGMIHKRSDLGDEYYFPFYQNPLPPFSEIDGPFDENEMYDYQQSVNPDMFPPLSQVFKRNSLTARVQDGYLKRGASGMPVHGLFRPTYIDPSERNKRYILSLPDVIDDNNIDVPEDQDAPDEDKRSVDDDENYVRNNFKKRHIAALARLGMLPPSLRFSGGRYSRSGRARFLMPSQELYREHTNDKNFGIRQYIPVAEANTAAYSDDPHVPPAAIPAYSHPTGRILRGPLSNDLPPATRPRPKTADAVANNRWLNSNEVPKILYFKSLKAPQHSGKRYLLLPAVDNIIFRKTYPNSSLPSRRKNQ